MVVMMQPSNRPSAAHPPAPLNSILKLALLCSALVVGLLLMHGMNLHGASSPSHHVTVGEQTVVTEFQHTTLSADVLACDNCTQQGLGYEMAVGCVLAFVVVVLFLRRPTSVLARAVQPSRAGPRAALSVVLHPRPPSLISLCISRT